MSTTAPDHLSSSQETPEGAPATSLRIPWPGRFLLVFVFLWVTGVAFAVQFRAWAAPVLGLGDLSATNQILLQAALTLPPLLLLIWRWRRPRPQAMLQAWLWAALYLLALTPARLWPPAESQWVLLAQLVINLLLLALIWRFWRDDPNQQTTGRWSYAPALGLAALFAYPWLASGSLGSLLDTLIALALGLTTGIIAARIIGHTWLASLEIESHGSGRDLFTGGLTLGATLVILLSGISLNGVQLLLMVSVSALGWAAMALSRSEEHYTWRPVALLLGLAMAAILALVDSDSVGIIAMDPLLRWAAQAAGLSILIGWLAGIIAMIGFRSWGKPYRLRLAAAVAALLWVGGVAIYFTAGQPGFYGDRIFVILDEQADVSAAAAMDDYDARREFVYDTLVQQATQSQAGLRQTLDRFGDRLHALLPGQRPGSGRRAADLAAPAHPPGGGSHPAQPGHAPSARTYENRRLPERAARGTPVEPDQHRSRPGVGRIRRARPGGGHRPV